MKRIVLLLLTLGILFALPALAQVPQTMSYQGVLTDAAGNIVPDGYYDLTFRIYNVPTGGAALFTEAHTGAVNHVQVSKGGFSAIIGSIAPLNLNFDGPYHLGIQVAADPELVPRIALTSSPYAFGLRLPFICSTTAGGALLNGYNWSGQGGGLRLFDEAVHPTIRLEPDADFTGGFLQISRNTDAFGLSGFIVEGNVAGSQEPSALLYGSSVTAGLDLSTTGDAAALLPEGSVSAQEILDEPGVAQGHANGVVNIPVSVLMSDIVTTTITTPAPGYIVVQADAQHTIGGSGTSTSNSADFQIDEVAGGGVDPSHVFISGYSGGPAGARNFSTWSPVSIHRTYFKSAGTYTFRLEAYASQNEPLANFLLNPTITAQYFPTGYGSVTTAPAMAERGAFGSVQHTVSAGNGPWTDPTRGELVDLRELELRAAKATADAERARRLLLEARVKAEGGPNAGAPEKR